MTGPLPYLRRALELTPRRAAQGVRTLALMRWSAWRQRVAATVRSDLSEHALRRRLRAHAKPLFTPPLAVLPIAWPAEGVTALPLDRIRAAAADALAHRFDLLGSGPVQVRPGLEAAGLAGHVYRMTPDPEELRSRRRRLETLLPPGTTACEPIDWHIDFRSGYRWPATEWFSCIRFGHEPGVDVKVPWELSRFQHVAALGLAYRLDPEGPEGSRAAAGYCAQVTDWIAANPTGRGVNWACPMDVALRAVSWLSGVALFQDAPALTPAFRALLATSLHAHGRHIEANLEYDPHRTGNHYLSDIIGLLCIGAALPEFEESSRWCLYGMQELVSEMERQVLPDGADIEGSVPYHHLVAELFYLGTLVVLRLGPERRVRLRETRATRLRHPLAPPLRPLVEQAFDLGRPEVFPAWYLDRLLRMAEFAAAATKPDGRIPQIGDNDNGRAYRLSPTAPVPGCAAAADPCDRRTLLAVAGRLFGDDALTAAGRDFAADAALLTGGAPLTEVRTAAAAVRPRPSVDDAPAGLRLYEAGGLAVVRCGPLYLAISLARVPRTSTGGHFHNDLLAYELQWDGIDFVVDGGTFVYTPLPELRDAFRATAAHSTIVVSGREQRGWPAGLGRLFNVDRDATIAICDAGAASITVEARYEDVRHVRCWTWAADRLRVEDRLTVAPPATLNLNLAPGLAVTGPLPRDAGGCSMRIESRRRRADVQLSGVDECTLGEGFYSHGYGRRLPNVCVRAGIAGSTAVTEFALTHATREDDARVAQPAVST